MILRLHRALAARGVAGDGGFGLILVIGMSLILLGMLIVASTVSVNSLQSSRSHATFEQALAVAESGIDQTLARLQVNQTYNPCACALPAGGFSTDAAEKSWARSALLSYASTAGALQTTSQGQYVAIRPTGGQKVYSMSWVPSKANPMKSRLLKAEYLFSPFKPGDALSANGAVTFTGGSVTIQAAPGSPVGMATPVHTNGDITGSASSINIAGPVTSSGNYTMASGANVGTGSGGLAPLEIVPTIDPRAVYTLSSSSAYASNWYDLCPDGTVRAKDPMTPCASTNVLAGTAITTVTPGFRGWTYSISGNKVTWTMGVADSPYAGVYYVYQGDANVTGGSTGQNLPWNASILAEAQQNGDPGNSSTCNKLGGNISWHNTDVSTFYPGLVMEAGADLTIQASSNTLGDGLFAAADQVYLSSSSATTLTGAVVAQDTCPNTSNPSNLQGITINFDGNFESPVQSIIRTTQWIEYVG